MKPMQREFLPLLLLRDGDAFRTRLRERRVGAGGIAQLALFVCLACAVYGAALAGWRSPRLSLYVAAKLPMVFVGSTLVVAACNAVAAALLGTGLGLRDVLAVVFGAMALAGWILLALAPVALFLVAAACPGEGPDEVLRRAHNAMLVTHVSVLALAGLAGVGSLWTALRRMLPPGRPAAPLAAVWIGAYAFVGTQLGWMLRPFVGSPFYPVVFLREDALERNFYEFLFGEVLPFLFGFE
jgi:hypothetical protein